MKNQTGNKIFLACAIGAIAGLAIALHWSKGVWWIGLIGMTITGAVSFIVYEFKEFCQAIHKAWEIVIGYRPDRQMWKLRMRVCFWMSMAYLSLMIFIQGFVLLAEHELTFIQPLGILTFICFPGFMLLVLVCAWETGKTGYLWENGKKNPVTQKSLLLDAIYIFRPFNPFSIFIYYPIIGIINAPTFIFKGVCVTVFWLIDALGVFVNLAILFGRFIKLAGKLVYSDERLLCSIGGAFGFAVIYFSNLANLPLIISLIIGGVAGGLFGKLQYEVFSKRVFHLIPSN